MPQTNRLGLQYPSGSQVPALTDYSTLTQQIDDRLDRYEHFTGSKNLQTMGMFEDRGPNLAGWIVVQTDIPYAVGASADKMLRFDVRGYTYFQYNNQIDFSINFYMLNGAVHAPTFDNRGTMMFKNVRLLRANSNNTLAFAFMADIPANGDLWHYPKVVVDGWVSWSTEIPDAQFGEVYISRVTSLTAYTAVHTFADAEWQLMTLWNGWRAYDGGGVGGHATPRYRRHNGWVILEGLVVAGPLSSDITTMPLGYRIPHNSGALIYEVHVGGTRGRINVYGNGVVAAENLPNNSYVSLNGIMYPISGN